MLSDQPNSIVGYGEITIAAIDFEVPSAKPLFPHKIRSQWKSIDIVNTKRPGDTTSSYMIVMIENPIT